MVVDASKAFCQGRAHPPGHDDGIVRDAALQDLVPPDHVLLAGIQELGDAADEPALQVVLIPQPLRLDALLAARAFLPSHLGALPSHSHRLQA